MASPNARTKEETLADGEDTFGALNQHPATTESAFKVGVSVDRNKKCRRTMEDAHSFIYDFGGIRGQGYFAVFDGHAGKHAAEWCGEHFHEHLLEALRTSPTTPIPDLLNSTFHLVDTRLSQLAASEGTHSGCTAVVAFLRLEDEEGKAVGAAGGVGSGVEVREGEVRGETLGALKAAQEGEKEDKDDKSAMRLQLEMVSARLKAGNVEAVSTRLKEGEEEKKGMFKEGKFKEGMEKIKDFLGGKTDEFTATPEQMDGKARKMEGVVDPVVEVRGPAEVKKAAKRTLYTANVGDARAVLSRAGRAVRLTYDHKGSDAQEAKRITDAGGFVMNNRVNGVLAVTRSLGDSSMKEFVVGSPYTTETTLSPEDDYLIVACDGLWDVCQDQEAVDIIKGLKDPQEASKALLDHALQNFSSDNLSVLVVKL